MTKDTTIAAQGIGMAIGSTKYYYPNNSPKSVTVSPNNLYKGSTHQTNIKRTSIFRLFAPAASCKNLTDRPKAEEELSVLIGSETLSVGQNLQDADYLINIDLPWNPMILEQRIGRIDRPKQHPCKNIWNDQTGEKDSYGMAIATAFKTADAGDVFSAKYLINSANNLYNQLIKLKENWTVELQQEETLENLNITSERINSIKKRLKNFDNLPGGLEAITVKNTIKKLSSWKELKQVQKLLREYTEGSKTNLDDETFIMQLVQDTDQLNLITMDDMKPTSLRVSLAAILMRA